MWYKIVNENNYMHWIYIKTKYYFKSQTLIYSINGTYKLYNVSTQVKIICCKQNINQSIIKSIFILQIQVLKQRISQSASLKHKISKLN